MDNKQANATESNDSPWYQGVTFYQWMVLAIASAGWVFDVFEGQLFGSCMHQAMPVLLAGSEFEGQNEYFINLGLAVFLAGGAFGGIVFGMMADRWGRKRTMALTILVYSLFTGLTALSQTWWQLLALRFLVGMGVGGEWAVAAAIVAEVFPQKARPAASGIFHASSVLGTYLAVGAGFLVTFLTTTYPENGWRFGFLLGVLPALLILWVRVSMREPETWQSAKKQSEGQRIVNLGRLSDLFANAQVVRSTLVGTTLAIIGLATFWGAHFRGRDIVRDCVSHEASVTGESVSEATITNWGNFGWFLVTTGGGVGLLTFAPVSQRLGRRGAFVFFHLGAFVCACILFLFTDSLYWLLFLMPVFGFFTLAMHAGYAIYFPELYPTRLRGTGTGFCFNVARIVVVPVLLLFAWLQSSDGLGLTLAQAMLVLSTLFLAGAVVALLGPETRNKPLPD